MHSNGGLWPAVADRDLRELAERRASFCPTAPRPKWTGDRVGLADSLHDALHGVRRADAGARAWPAGRAQRLYVSGPGSADGRTGRASRSSRAPARVRADGTAAAISGLGRLGRTRGAETRGHRV